MSVEWQPVTWGICTANSRYLYAVYGISNTLQMTDYVKYIKLEILTAVVM
jgi:hypothetical protein